MREINCSLVQESKTFNSDAVLIAKRHCLECDFIPTSITAINARTIQFKFEEYWNESWIITILTNMFEGLGGVEVDGCSVPITII